MSMLPKPNFSHLSPMLMAPSCRGETWMLALGDRARYRASLDEGFGTGDNMVEVDMAVNCMKILVRLE